MYQSTLLTLRKTLLSSVSALVTLRWILLSYPVTGWLCFCLHFLWSSFPTQLETNSQQPLPPTCFIIRQGWCLPSVCVFHPVAVPSSINTVFPAFRNCQQLCTVVSCLFSSFLISIKICYIKLAYVLEFGCGRSSRTWWFACWRNFVTAVIILLLALYIRLFSSKSESSRVLCSEVNES